jgi:acetyl esterase/lipase
LEPKKLKVRTSYIAVTVVVLLAVAVAGVAISFRASNTQVNSPLPSPTQTTQFTPAVSPSPTAVQTPLPTQTPQLAGSSAPTNSQVQTTTPPASQNPTQNPTPHPAATYKDLNYGGDPDQKFDVYIPESSEATLPLIILVHGGAWTAGDKGNVSAIAQFLSAQGFVVVNMNYRLLPEFSYPAPLEDFQLLLQWISQNALQYRIDTARIGMSGHSAGGHLISLYALTQDKNYIAGGNTLPKVVAVAPLAGGYTLEGINITDPRREDTIMEWLSTANPQSLGLPIDQVDSSDSATFLLLHGSADVNSPPSQAVLFYQKLVENGVSAQIKIYPGRTHLTLVSGIPSNDEVAQDFVAFFNEKLK